MLMPVCLIYSDIFVVSDMLIFWKKTNLTQSIYIQELALNIRQRTLRYKLSALVLLAIWGSQSHAAQTPDRLLNIIKQNWYCVSLAEKFRLQALCVIREQITFAWYTIGISGNINRLAYQPSTGLEPSHLSLSPDGSMVALVFADEGHPVIVIHDVAAMLAAKKDKLFGRGVYPGGLSQVCWQKKQLVLESDQDLSQSWHLSEEVTTQGGYFLLDPVSHQIKRISRNPC